MNKINSKNDYFKEYMRQTRICELCVYCNYYCTKRDKHYKTEEHLINISKQLHLNIELLKK